jgi:hypothetical protein
MTRHLSLLVVLILLVHPAFAQDGEETQEAQDIQDALDCRPRADVPVNIHAIFDEPRYDFSQNLHEMQALSSDHEHSIPQYHEVTMGLTRYEPILELRVPMVIVTSSDGLSCAHVKRVDVRVGYRDVTVLIASEIPQHSCGFVETFNHEGKHVAVNRQLLDEFVPRIEARLKEYMEKNGVFRTENADYAERVMNEKLKAIINDMVADMDSENEDRQRQVDSPEEYARLSHVCNGELARIASVYRATGK